MGDKAGHPAGLEDYRKKFGFESTNKGDPQAGFSWKVVDPMAMC